MAKKSKEKAHMVKMAQKCADDFSPKFRRSIDLLKVTQRTVRLGQKWPKKPQTDKMKYFRRLKKLEIHHFIS